MVNLNVRERIRFGMHGWMDDKEKVEVEATNMKGATAEQKVTILQRIILCLCLLMHKLGKLLTFQGGGGAILI